ncbi:hypothetical protein GCM10027275_33080 [Rhabdobacter roseus]|uniref:DUF4136 domain-containing protein n=1 Tax=Rhabdobacter roseus TaxID=1655419 RepID=A0A840TZZ8_9BACT|nr:DUF4136 domain-containing protein [Rhabdobacter roseus]MBB5285470.1 hypothetical protein [Rhabdobacter roseus]
MKAIGKIASYLLVVLLAGGMLVSCSQALQVQYDYDTSVNLKQFKTFKVEAERNMQQDPLLGSELNRRRLTDAVTQVMQQKGYKLDSDNPEIVVRYMTDVKDRQQVRSNNNFSPYWWWYGPMNNNISTYNYQESRFILNIYQSESNRMVWQGWASGKVKAPNKRDDRDEMMRNTIMDILRSFPQATADTYTSR